MRRGVSREGLRGRKNWKKVPELKIKASDGTKVPVPNPLTVVEDVVVARETIAAAVSPTFTEHSDYTVSSASIDEKATENAEMQIESFNGKLGQWDIVEKAACITSVRSLWNEETKVLVMCPGLTLQSPFHRPCSWEHTPRRRDGRSTSSEHSEALCWPPRDEMHPDSQGEFDIVYDVFYQDEAFEPYEAFMVTEDLQNGVQEESDENVDQPDDTLSRSATPPLERVESPEFSSRVNLKSLPSMSTCNSNEEFLSFSRRDLSVLRQSLRELQVGMFQENFAGLHGGTSEEIQEDVIPARGLIEDEEKELVPKVLTARSSFCQEMLTQQERKVRPLSAARIVRPFSSSVVLGIKTQTDDLKERCTQLSAVAELPWAEFNGAQVRENEIGETVLQREKKVLHGSADIDRSFRRADLGSSGSSLTSSYATPRTGISADDQEASVCKKRPSSYD
ncbi:hypothetical protein Mapa_012539 [Marchantia paleacea]|nr:hypothetical protein Mapa_012539 [Marchantia paleacea]